MILAAASGLVAARLEQGSGVSYAPRLPRARQDLEATADRQRLRSEGRQPVDLSDIDPLAPRYKEWDERAAKIPITEPKRAETLPFGGDRWGRDVLQKAMKGSEVSIFVGLFAAVLATLIGTMLGAMAGYCGGKVDDFLEWFYNIFTSIPYILLIFAFAAVLQRRGIEHGRS